MKLNRTLRKICKCDDDGVAFQLLSNLPGVVFAEKSSSYYGSVRVRMANGKKLLELNRTNWKRRDPWLYAVKKLACSVMRYRRALR